MASSCRGVGDWTICQRGDLVTPPRESTMGSSLRAVESEPTSVESALRIGFVGTYPPRRCGIATFTRDLAAGIRSANQLVDPLVVAVTDAGSEYEYPDEVQYELQQGTKGNYARAAELAAPL